VNKQTLADKLTALSKLMHCVATDMTTCFPDNYDIIRHGNELMGASQIALDWAKEIEKNL
jgi:hypothetical protein